MSFFVTRYIILIKHYFDKWMFNSILKEMLKTNFILNKICEEVQHQCDDSARKCDELRMNCNTFANECEALRERCRSLREESEEILVSLIDIKVSTAEQALRSLRKARV